MNKSRSKFALNIFTLLTLLAMIFGGAGVRPAHALDWFTRGAEFGLGDPWVFDVFVDGTTVYAATINGLSISPNINSIPFSNRTMGEGLGDNTVYSVYVSGANVYAGTWGGLSISTDGGNTFTNKTTANGLGSNVVNGVFVSGSNVYAATDGSTASIGGGGGGLSISTDGGNTFTNKTTANGLCSNNVTDVFVSGGTIYVAMATSCLSISTDGGNTFTNKTAGTLGISGGSGLYGVYASGLNIYVATTSGLSISTDGGATFTNRTTANGLGGIVVSDVYASGSSIYAATNSGYAGMSGGLSISTDGGATFTNYNTANGFRDNRTYGVFVNSTTIFAATKDGLSFGGDISTKDLTWFGFSSPSATGVFSGTNVAVTVPFGTDVTALVAVFGTNGFSVKVGATNQVSGTTPNDFTAPVTYTVTAVNGSTQNYIVTVTVAPLSVEKDITAFDFASPAVYGDISGTDIAILVPNGTDVTTLVPTISHTGASVSPNSGVAQDFTNPVIYTVTAEDASTQNYTVTVTVGTWYHKTTANGLGSNYVFDAYVSASNVYAGTTGGLSISTNGGSSFTNKTTANGLGNNTVGSVYVVGSTVYAATNGGLSTSTDGGSTFTNKTTADGLGSNSVYGVYASGSTVYAATTGGLSISTNGGSTFTNKTTANGLGNNLTVDVYASGSTVYAATLSGLSISTNGGSTFTNRTTANGLGSNNVTDIFVSGSKVYAATDGGLSISTDGGATFTNKTTANGLGSNYVGGVYASGSTVYAATFSGVSISTDGGTTFVNKTGDGMATSGINDIYASGSTVYAATIGGLSFATFPSSATISDGGTQTFGPEGITITDAAGGNAPGLVTVTRTNTPPAGVTPVPDQLSFWIDIDAAVNSGLNVSLTLCYSLADIPAGVDEANLALYRYAGGTWTAMGFDSRDLVNHCVTKNNITDFSVWTLVSDDTTPPTVTSITRASANPTSATSVNFTVSFSEAVTGVDGSDFIPTTTGVSGSAVSGFSGSGSSYTVSVNTGTGNGTIRLDVNSSGTGIVDANSNPFSAGFTSGEVYTVSKNQIASFRSTAANDGWILESAENSNAGGAVNSTATTFNLGDDAADKQYRAILQFNTATLPDNAVIAKVTLKIRKQGLVGSDPFTILGGLRVDMRKPFFGADAGLYANDFQAAAGKTSAATFSVTPASNWYSALMNAAGRAYVNKTGTTQFRLRFATDDNNDNGADYMKFFSGNYATAGYRPMLIIEYTVP
ncbi:MAG: hypothetical protein HZB18_14290 [Chloroflexi bacterium]|nr:hypothetical protein [Chloroflexota bacterium]